MYAITNQLINLMKSNFKALILAFSILFISSHFVQGQDFDVQLSNTYYISDVNIIQKPGQMIEMGAIIVKDGVIQDVGKNLSPPADAIIVKADSMYLYPGFIDAYNNIGIKKSEQEQTGNGRRGGGGGGNRNSGVNPGNPPNNLAGITPERTLKEMYDHKAKSTSSWREAGFTASMSVPEGGMLPGQATIILHSSKDADAAIVKQEMGIVGTFETAGRVYPATILGVMAKYRDIHRKAGFALKHENAYKANPVGMPRPSYDASLKALYPITTKTLPIYFEAEKLKDISRVLTLQNDLGFNPVLINVKQATIHADKIKSSRIPLVLSLDVPHSDDKKKKGEMGKKGERGKKGEKEGEDKEEKKKEKKKEVKGEKDPEKEALQARKDEAIKEYQSQAAMLTKKGVSYGFSGKDAKVKDVKKNLKAMMEHGITEDQVLAALTTNPAQMYGVSNIMGTVEKGKLANFFVSSAPYFEDDSKIKYVFVEGNQFEYEVKEKKKKSGDGEASADLSGFYEFAVEIPGETQKGTLNIKKDGDSYAVTMITDGDNGDDVDEVDPSDVDVDGNSISFPMEVDNDGFKMKLVFDLEIDQGDIEGSVTAGEFGTFPMTGEKIGDPKNNN